MDDLITLSCPSCGGQLKLDSNTTTYTCYYCGQQHRLRIEDVEEYGRCPICRRNDKVEKVTAIRLKGGKLSAQLAPPEDPEKSFVYQPKPKPKPLQKPTIVDGIIKSKYTKLSKIILPVSIGLIILSSILTDPDSSRKYPTVFVLLGFAGLIISIVFFMQGKWEEKILNKGYQEQQIINWQSKNKKIEKDWTDYIQRYNNDFHHKKAVMKKKYAKAMQRYESLYYCHRDDCVFIPGESGYAPSAKMEQFLFKQFQKEQL